MAASGSLTLREKNGEELISLKGVNFITTVYDFLTETTMTLEFVNDKDSEALDVLLTVPIDPQASIFGLAIQVGTNALRACSLAVTSHSRNTP